MILRTILNILFSALLLVPLACGAQFGGFGGRETSVDGLSRPITFVQSGSVTGAGSLNVHLTVTSGDGIVACFAGLYSGGGASSVAFSDSQSNTYNQDSTEIDSSTNFTVINYDTGVIECRHTVATTSGNDDITVVSTPAQGDGTLNVIELNLNGGTELTTDQKATGYDVFTNVSTAQTLTTNTVNTHFSHSFGIETGWMDSSQLMSTYYPTSPWVSITGEAASKQNYIAGYLNDPYTLTGSMSFTPSTATNVNAGLLAVNYVSLSSSSVPVDIAFSPVPGTYVGTQSVALSSTSGNPIYYTTDGSPATTASTLYTAPINVATSMTINAVDAQTGTTAQSIQAASTGWKCITVNGGTSGGVTCQSGSGVGSNQPSAWSMTFGSTMQESLSTTASSGETQALFVYSGAACDSCSSIAEDKWIEPTAGASYIANAEMDMYQFDSTRGINHMFGLQCNQQAGINQWQYDNNGSWHNSGITDHCPLPVGSYTHVVYTGHWVVGDTGCGGQGCNYYDQLIIDGTVHNIDASLPASTLTSGWSSVCGLQDQIDLTNTTTSGQNPTTAGFNIQNENVSCSHGIFASVSAPYTISGASVIEPSAAPPAGTYDTPQLVALSSTTPSSVTYFSLDGSQPTASAVATAQAPVAVAPACTAYITTAAQFATSLASATPGSINCIATGTYDITATDYIGTGVVGSSSAFTTWTSYNGPVNFVYTGSSATGAMIEDYYSTNTAAYLSFQGLTFNGANLAGEGFSFNGASHVRVDFSTFNAMGAAGVLCIHDDYCDLEHNVVFHAGYNQGWSSGLDISEQAPLDSYDGIHNVIAWNVVSGEFDGSTNHTDGNGIIVDNTGVIPSGTSPTLFIGNVIYGNGGRCIEGYGVSGLYVVNNTCYSDGLDENQTTTSNGEITINVANNIILANNALVSYNSHDPVVLTGTLSQISCDNNLYYGGTNSLSGLCATGLTNTNPGYLSPTAVSSPVYTNGGSGQYANTLPASTGLQTNLWVASATLGVDPGTLVSGDLATDIERYAYLDIDGMTRPTASIAVGAYQYQSGTIQAAGAVVLNTDLTVKAISTKTGMGNSPQLTAGYTIAVP